MPTVLEKSRAVCCNSTLEGVGEITPFIHHCQCPEVTTRHKFYEKDIQPCGVRDGATDGEFNYTSTHYRTVVYQFGSDTMTVNYIRQPDGTCLQDPAPPPAWVTIPGSFSNPDTAAYALSVVEEDEPVDSGSQAIQAWNLVRDTDAVYIQQRRSEYFVLCTNLVPGLTYEYRIKKQLSVDSNYGPSGGTFILQDPVSHEFTATSRFFIHGGTLNVPEADFIAENFSLSTFRYDPAPAEVISVDGTVEIPTPLNDGEYVVIGGSNKDWCQLKGAV